MNILNWTYLFWVCIVLPFSVIRNVKRTRERMAEIPGGWALYSRLITFQLLVLGISVVVAWRNWMPLVPAWSMTVMAYAIAFGWVGAKMGLSALFKKYAPLNDQSVVRSMAPQLNARGIAGMAAMCVAAGVCEEYAFRRVLPAVMEFEGAGFWMAAVLANVVFGLLHATQGRKVAVLAGVLGFVNALMIWGTGSFWSAVISHTLYDFLNGVRIAREAAREREVSNGKVPESGSPAAGL